MRRTSERKKALASGAVHYFTGLPCGRGHVAKRYTQSGKCVECHKAWEIANRLKNPKPVRERQPRLPRPGRQLLSPEERLAHIRASKRKWDLANRDARRALQRRRRARKRAAEGSHTAAEIKALFARQRGKCASCKRSIRRVYHADHIMPLKLGGSNWITNIQLLCPTCNHRKQAMHPLKWAHREGRLI